MDESPKNTPAGNRVSNVIIGDASTKTSAVIFVLLCLIPALGTVLFGAVDETTWIVILLLLTVIIVLWAVESWRTKGCLFNSSSLQLPVLGLALVGVVQLLPFPATRSFDPHATRFFVIRLVVFLLFFAAALAFVNSERRLKSVAYYIVIFGVIMAFAGILMKLSDLEGIYGVRETPQAISFGPFVNQHHFAAFMVMTGGVTLGLILDRTKKGRERKVLLAAALIVMGVAVVWTSSRGGMLGFVSMLAFGTLLSMIARRKSGEENAARMRPIAIAAGGAALLFVIFGLALFLGGNDQLLRATGAVRADVDISTGRFHFWPIAIAIFLDRPLLGAGLDAFGVAFTQYDTWSGYFRVEQAHNEYLQILADAGILGFLCVAAFVYLLARKGLKTISDTHGFRRSVAIGALAGCFGILIHSFFDFPLRTYSNGFFFLLLSAIATVHVASSDARHSGRINARER